MISKPKSCSIVDPKMLSDRIKTESSQTRTPKEYVHWFEEILNYTKRFRQNLRTQNILHIGIAKFFYEELFPLYRLLQHKLEEWNDVTFTPIRGNQNLDVKVNSSRNNFLKYIEITQADMNYKEHLRMQDFLKYGHVCMTGKVQKKGTPVDNAVKKHSELNSEKKKQICDAIKKKQKVRETPDDTGLLVYFDDYIAFANAEDVREMEEFSDSIDSLWNNQYMCLFVVGASGHGFWERGKSGSGLEMPYC